MDATKLGETIPGDRSYRFLIHDHDSIFLVQVDEAVHGLALKLQRTPVRAPKAFRPERVVLPSIRVDRLDSGGTDLGPK
ncbi:MAG: hypothetical protein JO356_06380 [Acidobacteria bacterium]|nr:hypothetical protein [Acidobacteriota bacterium]